MTEYATRSIYQVCITNGPGQVPPACATQRPGSIFDKIFMYLVKRRLENIEELVAEGALIGFHLSLAHLSHQLVPTQEVPLVGNVQQKLERSIRLLQQKASISTKEISRWRDLARNAYDTGKSLFFRKRF